jgi:hypothetical protein
MIRKPRPPKPRSSTQVDESGNKFIAPSGGAIAGYCAPCQRRTYFSGGKCLRCGGKVHP